MTPPAGGDGAGGVATRPGSRFAEDVLGVVASLPAGQVATYGEVAAEAGRPGAARAVGAVLRARGGEVPWWRVVAADGRLAPRLEVEQSARLAADGVLCRDGRVRRGRG